MALFTQYALAAANEALSDSGCLQDMSDEQKDRVVSTSGAVRASAACTESSNRVYALVQGSERSKMCSIRPLPTIKVF